MPYWLSLILGPELFWLAVYLFVSWLGGRNHPSTPSGNNIMEHAAWAMSYAAVPLSFLVYLIPGTNRWWLLGRLALAGFIGINACLLSIVEDIDYPEAGRNSGLMGYWIMGVIFGGIIYIVGAGITTLLLLRKR